MLNLMQSRQVLRCRDSIRRTERLILEEGTSAILESWTVLLWEIAEDMTAVEEDIKELTSRMATKERLHQQDLAYFEDLQTQLEEEHKNEFEKEKLKIKKALTALEKEIEARDEELNKAMEVKTELLERINGLFRKNGSLRVKKAEILKDKEALTEELAKQNERVASLEKELRDTKALLSDESDKCFQEGIRIGRKLAAIEEMAVLEELEILKEIEMELEGNSLKRTDSEITLQKSIDEPG